MFKNIYKKYIKKFFTSKGADSTRVETSPFRDWKIIVLCFFGGFVVSLALNIYMLLQINNDSFFASSAPKYTGAVLNRDGLGQVLADLAAKETFLARPATTTASVVDPSR